MTQQPFTGYPPQYPAYPQQVHNQMQQPYAPPPAPQGYPAQAPYGGYPQGYPQQAPQPAVPLANGTLDDFYSQPSGGGGPSVSWKGKPEGSWIQGTVTRDVGQGDVIQDSDPVTGQPKFFRDGRPKFVMKVPLQVQPSQEFPEGEAVLYVRGQLRDELVRAMTAAGAGQAPKAGDQIVVQLTQRKPSRQGNPQNVFAVQYAPAQPGQAPAAAPQAVAPQPAPPVPQAAPQAPAPAPQVAPQPVPQMAPQMQAPQAPAPAPVFQQPAPQQPQAPAPTLAPQAPAPQGGQLPPQFTPEQAELFARLAGQQQQAG